MGALVALFLAAASACSSAPVKTSKYPWINTWAVEYYGADGSTLQEDVDHFDIHLSPHNIQGVKGLSPNSLALLYEIWREQYENDDPGAVNDRRKIDSWCAANGKNKEDFYCHYGRDVTIKGLNLTTGQDEYTVIPGWDDSNDPNGDDIRDWPSDYGVSSSVGGAYLADSTKNWAPNQWVNATLVDRNGNTYRVIGNNATTLNLASGAPVSGRYGLSAAGSPDPFATAKTRAESRAKSYIWQNYAYAMNLGNPDYQSFRAYDARKLIVDGDTSWDPDASTLWNGFMIDNTQPEFPWSEVVDGTDTVTEYPDRSKWRQDQVDLFRTVRNTIGPDRFVMGNTGSYDYMEIADVGGGQHQEQYVAIVNEHGPVQWDYWKQQSDKGVYSLVLPSWDCWPDQSERERMHYLAFFYMGQQPYIYLGFRGFGYDEVYHWDPTPYNWLPAAEVDVGTPVDGMYKLAKSGTDPVGQPFYIYTRRYSKALIVCRPKQSWDWDQYGDNTGVTFDLPSYDTGSGQSNLYKPLHSDKSFGAAVSKMVLRNAESFIMFPADTAVPPPPDTTGPQISGITADSITDNSAVISWTTNESVTSTVEYGTTTAYGTSVDDSETGTSHSVSLTGLQAGTDYHFRVKCLDDAGRSATSSDYVFTTTTAPTTGQGFLRDWLLLGPFDDPEPFGTGNDYIDETAVYPSAGSSSAGKTWTEYHSSTDKIDLLQALAQSNYQAGYANVYVNSPTTQDCLLLLGSDDGIRVWLNGSIVHENLVSRSASPDDDVVPVTLAEGWNQLLIEVTQEEGGWAFYARLTDVNGVGLSGLTFQLDAPNADSTPPQISGVKCSADSSGSAAVSWQTDEAATSVVDYGLTTGYGSTVSDPNLLTQHTLSLTSLAPGKTYHIRVKSADAAGNVSVSGDYSVKVPVPAPFFRQWLVVGPFNNVNRVGFNTDYVRETSVTPSSGSVSSGKTWFIHRSSGDLMDFNSMFSPNDNVVAYAHLYVYSPTSRSCQLRIGSDDGVKVWLNGKLALSNFIRRSATKDTDIVPITLSAGWNRLLIKVDEVDGHWGFYARICDAAGSAVPGLSTRLYKP